MFKSHDEVEKIKAKLERYRAQEIDLKARQGSLQRRFAELLDAEMSGEANAGDKSELASVKEKISAVGADLSALAMILKDLPEKHQKALAERRAREIRALEAEAKNQKAEILRKAEELEALVEKLTDQAADIAGHMSALFSSLPDPKPSLSDFTHLAVSPDVIAAALRLQLRKEGHRWAHDWPWDETAIPSFSDRLNESIDVLLKHFKEAK